jgi:superfamily II DNA or RNA helicase
VTIETLTLRGYQQRTIDSLYRAYGAGRRRVPIVLPTGAGKTVVFARVGADAVTAGGGVLALAHRQELIDAAEEKFKGSSSGLDVGVLQGKRREVDRRVTVSSMQTAVRPGALALLKRKNLRLVIVDECHHIAAPSYQTILRELGVFEPDGPLLLGVTATLGRADGLALGDTFDGEPAEVVPMTELIDDGYLLRPKGIRVRVEGLDLSRVRSSRTSDSGLDDRAVGQAMSDSLAPAAVARAVLEHCKGRHGVAFLPSIELSKEQARVFTEHGLRSIHVDADTPKQVRREIIRRARLGEYDVVCNVGLFTEGTDVPIWSFAVLGRPTSSETLFQQMAGRPLRPYPGQTDALLLDVVGLTGRHHLRSVVQLEGAEMIEDLDDELRQFDEDESGEEPARTPVESDPLPPGADGELGYELVDLFSASHTAWQRSPRGVWYLPTGNGRAVVLAPAADVDTYDVRWSDTGDLLHEDPCDIAMAMSWGEKAAKAAADRELDRTAAWRNRKLTRAERLQAIYRGEAPGGEHAPLTTGALVDAQDARWAAAAVDTLPWLQQVTPLGYWTT